MSSQPSRYGTNWNREESILAFYLYCQIPFQKTKANNPDVQELARILNRSPGSVARKLGNFGSFDPQLQGRGIKGLPNTGIIAEQVWTDFHDDWDALVLEAEAIRENLESSATADTEYAAPPGGPSERLVLRKERLHQDFFRNSILASYSRTCCVTGISVAQCLIASHIIPWSKNLTTRANPLNGLCLSATFDKLFDNGLMTIDNEFRVIFSNQVLRLKSKSDKEQIAVFHGKEMIRPQRFMPSQEFLQWHRENVFASV